MAPIPPTAQPRKAYRCILAFELKTLLRSEVIWRRGPGLLALFLLTPFYHLIYVPYRPLVVFCSFTYSTEKGSPSAATQELYSKGRDADSLTPWLAKEGQGRGSARCHVTDCT